MASRTLAWPPEKTENREASVGAKTPTSQGWRSQGQARKPRQHWGNGQKKSQPMRVGILGIGGGNDDLPQNSLKARAPRNSLSYKRRSHLAQPLPDNPTRETIFSPDFPAPDEGDGFAVKPDTWRFSATTLNPAFGRRFGSQNGNRIDPGISPSADMGRSRGCPCSGSSRPCHGCRTRCLGSG